MVHPGLFDDEGLSPHFAAPSDPSSPPPKWLTDRSGQGVSVLESPGELIDAFRTYYDAAAFLGG
jgi:hypothetical protein